MDEFDVSPMLPVIFKYYKKRGYKFYIIKDLINHCESLRIIPSHRSDEFEDDSPIVHFIKQFSDLNECYYNELVQHTIDSLSVLLNNKHTK